MKEPWEVYEDEFLREVKRGARPEGEGESRKRAVSLQDVGKAEHAAAQATAYQLVDGLNWEPDEAVALIDRLRAVKFHGEGSRREKLRHAYTDFMLSRRNVNRAP